MLDVLIILALCVTTAGIGWLVGVVTVCAMWAREDAKRKLGARREWIR